MKTLHQSCATKHRQDFGEYVQANLLEKHNVCVYQALCKRTLTCAMLLVNHYAKPSVRLLPLANPFQAYIWDIYTLHPEAFNFFKVTNKAKKDSTIRILLVRFFVDPFSRPKCQASGCPTNTIWNLWQPPGNPLAPEAAAKLYLGSRSLAPSRKKSILCTCWKWCMACSQRVTGSCWVTFAIVFLVGSIGFYRGKRCVRRLKKHRFHRSPTRVTVTWCSTALSTEFLNLPGAPDMHFVSRPMHWSVSVPKIHTHPIACTASTASANSSQSYHYPTLPGKQQHGAHTRKFSLAISPCQPCSNSTSYPP